MGNRLITLLANMLNNTNLTDLETCYKVFTREVKDRLRLTSERFGFEPEFTARVARMGVRIYEVHNTGVLYDLGFLIGASASIGSAGRATLLPQPTCSITFASTSISPTALAGFFAV